MNCVHSFLSMCNGIEENWDKFEEWIKISNNIGSERHLDLS